MRLVILGGSFNPVHLGHLHIIEAARNQVGPARAILVPSYRPLHKSAAELVSSRHRLNMLKLSVAGTDYRICEYELERRCPTYALETVRYLADYYKLRQPPFLIVGEDLADEFEKWHNYQALAREARLLLAARPDQKSIDLPVVHDRLANLSLSIASSSIRKALVRGESCRFLLPPGVYDYIIQNNLYGSPMAAG